MPEYLRLIPGSDPEWDQWLSAVPHDFHHLGRHHELWEELGHGEAWMAVVGSSDRFLAWPYLLRQIPQDEAPLGEALYDITSVDGYAGPLCYGCRPGDAFLASALDMLFRHWEDSRVVSVFTRFHPVLRNEGVAAGPEGVPECLSESPAMHGLRHHGHTVSMDLRLNEEEARQQYRRNHARQIRKAQAQGVVAHVDPSPEAFEAFVRLYYGTMERNQADTHYFFPETFLRGMVEMLGEGAAIHTVTYEGRIVAAMLLTEYQGIVHALLGGMDETVSHLTPTKVLLDNARQWAKARGNRYFHLGGGRGCQDSDPLFYFKSGFSSSRHCFYTGRWILNSSLYDSLVAGRRQSAEANQSILSSPDFFPLYRAPLVPAVADTPVTVG